MSSSTNEYRNMLTKPTKMLTSQFKISFNLVLNMIYSYQNEENFNTEKLKNFIKKSMMCA